MGPAEAGPRRRDLLGAERGAVGGRRSLLVGRPVADRRPARDQRGPGLVARGGEGRGDRVGVVTVDAHGAPAAGREPRQRVVAGRERGRAVDRNAVVVVEDDQSAQAKVARERYRLVADALHQAAVSGDGVGVVIDQRRTEPGREVALGDGHADRVAEPLAQGSGGGFDPPRGAVLGVTGRPASELTEARDLLDRHVLVPRKVEECVQQHRAMPGREHEAVAVGPVGPARVEAQEAGEQDRRRVGHSHGHSRVAGIGGLDRIHGKRANGVRHVVVADGGPRLVVLGSIHDGPTKRWDARPGAGGTMTASPARVNRPRSQRRPAAGGG